MQIRVLGHLEASVDGHPVALDGAKQRAVLAMLGLEPNRTITADRLIEGLWGEEPPQSAAKMVQNYIWRLRKALAGGGGVEILTVRSELREFARGLDALPVLVLATGQEAAALARLEPSDSIALAPLDEDAVRMIAGFYAPAAGGEAIPVAALLAASGGVARRVHEAASEWARREAMRRVDVVADRTATGRSEARALEDELAGSVVDLQSARERAGLVARDGEDADGPVVCPYKGLAAFDREDAEYFFGRERLVAELVARLVGAPLLAVIGPSGSGKSSVIRAGLLPALIGGVLPGSDQWVQALMRPAARPLTVSGLIALPLSVGVDALRFSSDGGTLAVGGDQPVLVDTRTHTPRVLARLINNEAQTIHSPRFSADGRTLFAAVEYGPQRSTTIQRWDARSGRQLGAERSVRRRPGLVTLLVMRDARRLLTTSDGGPTVIRDARTLRPLKRLAVGAEQAALSRDDRTMLLGGRDGSVRFVDLVTGNVRTASRRHGGAVVRAVFSADGRTAVTAGEDRRAIVWNVKRAAAGETLQGHAGQITGLAITRDSRTLYASGLDGKVIVWDLAGAHRLGRPFEIGSKGRGDAEPYPGHAVPAHAVSPDGRVLAIGQRDGTVNLIDARTLQIRSSIRAVPTGRVRTLGYVPGGRLLVVGGDNGFLALVDPRSGEVVKPLAGHDGMLLTTSFSADGRLMASSSGPPGESVLLWALPAGRRLGPPLNTLGALDQFGEVSLSPDGRTLAATSPSFGVELIDVAKRERRGSLRQAKQPFIARFTPDGRKIVAGSFDGSARVWSTKTRRPMSSVLAGHTGSLLWEAISPDGSRLATGSEDGTIRLVDLHTQRPLGAPLPGVPNRAVAPLFTPDGRYLFAISAAGRAYRWDVRPSAWARHACAVAGRTLTRAEWSDALPDRKYAPACSG